ncbi:MAG: hypothetical protein JXD21_06310 [Candidatus Omnitrophica bacterium]|nr:hypothetical protein [Candidatus Omnitrophota bacterium]
MDRKRYSPSFSPSDIKRLEEAFLDSPPRTQKPSHKKFSRMPFFIVIGLILILLIVYFRYSVIFVPKMKHPQRSLLNSQYLDSISLISKEGKIQFAQGIIYLPLLPGQPQGFVINTKMPLDLTKNDIYIQGSFLDGSSVKDNVAMKAIIRDDKFFSNSLTPLERKLAPESSIQEDRIMKPLKLDFQNTTPILLNLSRITQIRFEFYNPRNTPVSLLIKEIKLMRKEEE